MVPLLRRCLFALLRLLFRFEAHGLESLRTPGPVLLVPNHVSWIDWLFLWVLLEDGWKFATSSTTAQTSPIHRALMLNRFTFPIDTASPFAVKRMAEFLQSGGRLVLFAEGRLSLTGSLMKLFDGTGFLFLKTKAKVITCHLRGAQRLLFSPNANRKEFFPRISVHVSEVLDVPEFLEMRTSQARTRLTLWLRDQMVRQQFDVEMAHGPRTLPEAIVAVARMFPDKCILEDVSRQTMDYRRLLLGADVLSQQWDRWLAPESVRVGVLLPNINATPVVLLSLWTVRKVPAVLNFTAGASVMLACAKLAGIKEIITSRQFLARARLDVEALESAGLKLVYLEEVRAGVTSTQKGASWVQQQLYPLLPLRPVDASDTAVILFTSGSEGTPKGVELTHANILANFQQLIAITDLEDRDRVFNCLPIFHSFGLVVGTLLPLLRGMYVFLYPSPLHYRVIPDAVYDRACTVFLSTNTFLNGYARKAHPYDFRSVRYLFSAAEKLNEATAALWAQKYGVRILEGYGATECAPAIAITTPLQPKHGFVGRLLPGIEARLEPVEGVTEGGRLFVRGPNVMKGYLNSEANAQFLTLQGWYDTGDIVSIDSDGYLRICGRLKRFAKISGEMVSLTAVEEALAGAFPEYGLRCHCAVISQPDPDKGEVLVAVTNDQRMTLDQIRVVLRGKGFPNLSVPREVHCVREIPKLGTGKVDHRKLIGSLADLRAHSGNY